MQTLIEQLESIVHSKRNKQIRINGRQIMITPEIAQTLIQVHDKLQPCNQVWFVKLEERRMIDLAGRLATLISMEVA